MASHQDTVKDQFTRTAEVFSIHVPRDTPEVLSARVVFAELAPEDRILDVACGPGRFVIAAAERVQFATGLDLTAEMLKQAALAQQARGITNVSFDLGEAEHLPYPAASFDLVSCQFAIHHMPNPELSLAEMVRVAKSGGRLLIVDTVGPDDETANVLHNHIERLRDPSHTEALSLLAFRRMFSAHGLEMIKFEVRSRARSVHQWMLRAGASPDSERCQAVRKALEQTVFDDAAGFAPHADGDDLVIHHSEGTFLLRKPEP